MPIPDFQTLMLPLLQYVQANENAALREATEALADQFHLDEAERRQRLPSGRQATLANRVGWAKTYLVKAGLLGSPRRATMVLTDRGKQVLANPPTRITISYLARFEEFLEFRNLIGADQESVESGSQTSTVKATPEVARSSRGPRPTGRDETPEEQLETAYQRMRSDLAEELLENILSSSPGFFEQLVVDLLVKMGYGGTRKDAGEAIGKSHDEGIDGIIKEDRLGLDIIYIQAKRWARDKVVGRPDIQQFAGALQGQRAKKGVFITTSRFSAQALEYCSMIESKIALIDGEKLAQLMIDFRIGVTTISTYELQRIDSDYFLA